MTDKDLILEKKIAREVKLMGGRMFRVGGIVRDKLYNEYYDKHIENKDLDTETYGISVSDFKKILSKYGEIQLVGESFGVFKVKGYDIDFSLPRKERVIGNLHTDFDVTVDPFMPYEEAARRRDFTINQFMEDCLTGEIIDCFNGKEDLKNGIIRHVDTITFQEDSLRIFRAARFASKFNFKIAEETLELSKSMDISFLARERIEEEFLKVLKTSKKPSIFFLVLKEIGVLQKLLPWNENLEFNLQWLDEYRIVNTEYFKNKECIQLALLFLDNFDKWQQFKIQKEIFKINSIYEITEELILKITFLLDSLKFVSSFAQRQFLQQVKNLEELTFMSYILNPFYDISKEIEDFEIYAKKPLIKGKDLIDLGFKPNPLFSEILEFANDLQCNSLEKEDILEQIKKNYL